MITPRIEHSTVTLDVPLLRTRKTGMSARSARLTLCIPMA